MLLSLPFGHLSAQFVAVQRYCRLAQLLHFTYGYTHRSISLPDNTFQHYKLVLQWNNEVFLYEKPPEEDPEEEGEEKKEDEDEETIEKLRERVKKERAWHERRTHTYYQWVVRAGPESEWVQADEALATLAASAQEGDFFVFG